MKEFFSTQGGRHLYNSDLKNMQELALSITSVFGDCGGNFVIYGCNVANRVLSEGYVYIGGKIRYVEETNISTTTNLCIIEDNVDGPNTTYFDGIPHPQYKNYRVAISNDVPNDKAYVKYDNTLGRFPNLGDVFINHYALVKDGNPQYVNTIVSFLNSIIATGVKIVSPNESRSCQTTMDDNGNVNLMLYNGNDESVTYKFDPLGVIRIYRGGNQLWQLDGVGNGGGSGTDEGTIVPTIPTTFVYTPTVQLITSTNSTINPKTDYAIVNVLSPTVTLPSKPIDGRCIRIMWRNSFFTLQVSDTSKIVLLSSDSQEPLSFIRGMGNESVHVYKGGVWYSTILSSR